MRAAPHSVVLPRCCWSPLPRCPQHRWGRRAASPRSSSAWAALTTSRSSATAVWTDTALCIDLELAGIGRFTARACGGIDPPYAYSGPPLPPPDDAGGWSTLPSSFESDECSIDIVDGSGLSAEAFEATYRGKQPIVLRNLTRALGWKAHFAWRRPDLLAGFGDRMLIADTTHRPQGRGAEKTPGQAATLAEHIASFAAQHEALSRGELSSEPELERRYAFDRAFISERAPELLGHFSPPPQVRLKTVDHVRVPNPRS